MKAIKYRELKHMYEAGRSGPSSTSRGAAQRAIEARGFQPPRAGRGDLGPEWVKQMDPRAAAASTCWRPATRVDVTAFSNITGQIVYSTILQAYTQEAFVVSKMVEHDSHPLRRREDSRHRPHPRRGGRGAAGNALSQRRPGRGLHRDPVDDQARLHRAGDAGSDLLRPHAPDLAAGGRGGRDPRAEQGKAADRPGDRHDQQLQVEGHGLQHLLRPADNGPWVNADRARNWSIGPTSTPPSSCSPTSSIRTPGEPVLSSPTRCW